MRARLFEGRRPEFCARPGQRADQESPAQPDPGGWHSARQPPRSLKNHQINLRQNQLATQVQDSDKGRFSLRRNQHRRRTNQPPLEPASAQRTTADPCRKRRQQKPATAHSTIEANAAFTAGTASSGYRHTSAPSIRTDTCPSDDSDIPSSAPGRCSALIATPAAFGSSNASDSNNSAPSAAIKRKRNLPSSSRKLTKRAALPFAFAPLADVSAVLTATARRSPTASRRRSINGTDKARAFWAPACRISSIRSGRLMNSA